METQGKKQVQQTLLLIIINSSHISLPLDEALASMVILNWVKFQDHAQHTVDTWRLLSQLKIEQNFWNFKGFKTPNFESTIWHIATILRNNKAHLQNPHQNNFANAFTESIQTFWI